MAQGFRYPLFFRWPVFLFQRPFDHHAQGVTDRGAAVARQAAHPVMSERSLMPMKSCFLSPGRVSRQVGDGLHNLTAGQSPNKTKDAYSVSTKESLFHHTYRRLGVAVIRFAKNCGSASPQNHAKTAVFCYILFIRMTRGR